YDFNTGLLTSARDPNNQITSFSYDNMSRLRTITYPDGGLTTIGYLYAGTTSMPLLSAQNFTKKMSSSQNSYMSQSFDGPGRVGSVFESDPQFGHYIDTTFDADGRVLSVTNPHYSSTASSTDGSESISYDGLDRPLVVTRADGSLAKTYYGDKVAANGGASSQLCSGYGVGYPILTVDEAGKKRQTWIDAFGRTIEADEPDSSNNLTVGTCYAYDLNNNLTKVVQGSQTRTFVYDMISRLISETNPESGRKTYTYDSDSTMCGNGAYTSNGDLVSTTDAAGNCVMRYYDQLHRLTDVGNNS